MGTLAGGRLRGRLREFTEKVRIKRQIQKDMETAWVYRQGWEDHERLVCWKEHPQALVRPVVQQ